MTSPTPPTPPTSQAKVDIPITIKPNVSSGSLVSVILVAILLIAGAYIWASVSKADAMKEYTKKWNEYQTTVVVPALKRSTKDSILADSALKVANHAHVIAAQQSVRIQILKDSTATLDQHNRNLAAALGTLPDTGTINLLVHGLQAEVVVQKTTIDSLSSLDSTNKVEIKSLRFSNIKIAADRDSLKKVIIDWPVPPPAKKILGFLPQLSPKQAAIGSAIIGVITGYKLHR
jgi:hypothetical protein